jgi:hypothetical protein
MRGLEHLAGVEGMGVGVVVVEAFGDPLEDQGGFGSEDGRLAGREMSVAVVELMLGGCEELEEGVRGGDGHDWLEIPGDAAKAHGDAEGGGDGEGEGGDGEGGAEAAGELLDEEQEEIDDEHEEVAVPDEDMGDGGGDGDLLEVEGAKEGSDDAAEEEEQRLQEERQDFFHRGWLANKFSAERSGFQERSAESG